MNKIAKAAIIGTAALATLATSFEFASAGDGYWRNRGFHGHRWRHNGHFANRAFAAGVVGLAAGVVVGEMLSQPRVVYRERPDVVVEEHPVYAAPDDEYLGPADEAYADDPEYDAPRVTRRVTEVQPDSDRVYEERYSDEQTADEPMRSENYFPDRPAKEHSTTRIRPGQDVADAALEPWTAKWRSYCKQRYSSFNATTGTYKGYDGKSHFCTAG